MGSGLGRSKGVVNGEYFTWTEHNLSCSISSRLISSPILRGYVLHDHKSTICHASLLLKPSVKLSVPQHRSMQTSCRPCPRHKSMNINVGDSHFQLRVCCPGLSIGIIP